MLIITIQFVMGLCALLAGSHFLVDSAIRLAQRYQVPAFIVGTFLIGFGTSAPELFITFFAIQKQAISLSVGNVLGSYIGNIGLVLGLSACLRPIHLSQHIVSTAIPLLISSLGITIILCLDGNLSINDGLLLLGCLAIFCIYTHRYPSDNTTPIATSQPPSSLVIIYSVACLSIIATAVGSHWMIQSAQEIASYFGISDLVIGLTIVAIGTSLPELITALLCRYHDQDDLYLGNVIGSNIFCLLGILPLPILFSTNGVATGGLWFELTTMWILTLVFWLFAVCFNSNKQISRTEGAIILLLYIFYLMLLLQPSWVSN